MSTVDTTLHLSTQTLDWLANHPHARQFVRSVWDKLTTPAAAPRAVGRPQQALWALLNLAASLSRGRP